jgi:hypothetical protein
LTSIESIEYFATGLGRFGAVNTVELGSIAVKFDQLVADTSGVLRETNYRQRLNTSRALLLGLDNILANVPLPAGYVQVDSENFAMRVENARDSGNNGILIDGNSSQITPIKFERKNEFIVKSNPR